MIKMSHIFMLKIMNMVFDCTHEIKFITLLCVIIHLEYNFLGI